MLTEEIKREIEQEMARYPRKRGVCIEALKLVQKHEGWVSDESIRELADFLGMTPDELDSVATFYNKIFRRPVGKHVIFICDSVSCWIMGYDRVRERITELPNVCLGACDHAPVMMIDDDTHLDVEPAKIDSVLEKYR